MSDFISDGWSIFVAVASVVSMLACLVLLAVASRRKVMSGDNTTGHVWDGDLRELNNPLPSWWMWLFILTVVFSIGYLVLYPGAGARVGSLGWSSEGQHQAERDAAVAVLRQVGHLTPEQGWADISQDLADTLCKKPGPFLSAVDSHLSL